eukprot:8686571-Alexandrium_andersonii.AAC.1
MDQKPSERFTLFGAPPLSYCGPQACLLMPTETAVRIEGGSSSRRLPLLALLHQGRVGCCSTLPIRRVLMITRLFA